MNWFRHVSDAIYDAVAAAMGLDPEAQSTLDRIVPAYVPGVTTPQYNSNDNVIFFAVSQDTAPAEGNYVSIRGGPECLTITEVIPVSVLLTFYGPDADDDSDKVWRRLLVDSGAGSPRSILRKNRIVFNYGPGKMPPRPTTVPELEGTLWRRRCDLRLSLSYLGTDTLDMTPVEVVPEVKINVAE